jgi:hypothetical protein
MPLFQHDQDGRIGARKRSPAVRVFMLVLSSGRVESTSSLAGHGRRELSAMGDKLWATDPTTLRDIVLDRDAIVRRLQVCSALERVWLLGLLGRSDNAAEQGQALLARAVKKFRPLLVLARVCQGQYRWQEAARLQEEALRLAGRPEREAYARHQIGRRLFEEARYRDAAAEFEWARDLFRSSGSGRNLIEASEQAMLRARELADEPFPGNMVHVRNSSGPCPSSRPEVIGDVNTPGRLVRSPLPTGN